MTILNSLGMPCRIPVKVSARSGQRHLDVPRGVLPLSGFQSQLLKGEKIRSSTKRVAAKNFEAIGTGRSCPKRQYKEKASDCSDERLVKDTVRPEMREETCV